MQSWINRNVQLFCFVVAFICAAPLVIITPPFQVPDEQQHFFRAYHISEGHVRAIVSEGKAGASLPSSLIDLTSEALGSRMLHADRPVIQRPIADVAKMLHQELRPDVREFIDFSGAASYSPIPYLPQALAMYTARSFGSGPLGLMYSARIANLLVALIIISIAVKHTPFNKPGFMVFALLPMSLTLFASVSPDALVISSTFLFSALSLNAYVKKDWCVFSKISAISCAIVFCSIKIVYAPLLLISIPAFFQGQDARKNMFFQCALILIPVVITYAWIQSVSDLIVPSRIGTSVSEQLHYVGSHPWVFAKAVFHGAVLNDYYFFMAVGVLGWLSVKLPLISYVIPVIAFSVAFLSQAKTNFQMQKITISWWAIMIFSSVMLIALALYLHWTPVGAYAVEGVQGRYFIPLFPMMIVTLAIALASSKFRVSSTNALMMVSALGIVEATLTCERLVQVFWL